MHVKENRETGWESHQTMAQLRLPVKETGEENWKNSLSQLWSVSKVQHSFTESWNQS